jgi:glucokinase
MLLAGDIGGTKTLLGIFASDGERPRALHSRTFRTKGFRSLGDVIAEFLREAPVKSFERAVFGVAGPVTGRRAQLTNASWEVDAEEIESRFGAGHVRLLNDMEALAWSISVLRPDEMAVLQAGTADPEGTRAVIAPGTGLGTGLLRKVDGRYVPIPSEGGNTDFPARTGAELLLLKTLTAEHGRVRLELVVSGPGIANIHRIVHPEGCSDVAAAASPEEIPAKITQAAVDRRCPVCIDAVDLFASAYGAAAGNLALVAFSTGGLFLAGGVSPKILPVLQGPSFMEAFHDKAPLDDLLKRMPVQVILNLEAGLLGAAASLGDDGRV